MLIYFELLRPFLKKIGGQTEMRDSEPGEGFRYHLSREAVTMKTVVPDQLTGLNR